MKKLLICIVLLTVLVGCRNVVDKEPKDRRYTAAHNEIFTNLMLLPQGNGQFIFVPVTQSHYIQDRYEILYEITYDDGYQTDKWETVTKSEYDEFNGGEYEQQP